MKKLIWLLLLVPCIAAAQDSPFPFPPVLSASGRPLPGAVISICSNPPTGSPCTNFASVYSDQARTQLINQATSPIVTDSLGNVPATYAVPGLYAYTITSAGVSTTGPYLITISCTPGASCVAIGSNTGSISLTGTESDAGGTHSGTETFTGAVTASGLNRTIVVDGCAGAASPTYACTPVGIQAAITQASTNGRGTVYIPASNGTPVAMGTTSLNMANNVCLVGAGMESTVLQWSGNANAIVLASTIGACVKDMHLDFTGASNSSAAIRVTASDASPTEFNTVENLHITFVIPSSGSPTSSGIFVTGAGPSGTDTVLNTFKNINIENANQMISCTRCEGNNWQAVRGQNLGTAASTAVISYVNSTNESMDVRAEIGSSNFANEICFSDDSASQNMIVRLVCDNSLAGTALSDSGTYNTFDLTTIGASVTLGSVAATSQYRYTSSYTTTQKQQVGTIDLGGTIKNIGETATMGLTLKKGSGGGNYTNATTSYTVADSTNLCFTVTIPAGWKLGVSASGALSTATAAVVAQAALTDNAACSTANAGILVETAPIQGAAIGVADAFALNWIITGDGASHNIAIQFKTSNAADTASLINSSATIVPTMKFELMPSN